MGNIIELSHRFKWDNLRNFDYQLIFCPYVCVCVFVMCINLLLT